MPQRTAVAAEGHESVGADSQAAHVRLVAGPKNRIAHGHGHHIAGHRTASHFAASPGILVHQINDSVERSNIARAEEAAIDQSDVPVGPGAWLLEVREYERNFIERG